MFHPPTCVKCSINMYPYKNSVYTIDMFLDPPRPYKIWASDSWACPICHNKIMAGFSQNGVRHDEEGFEQLLNMALRQGEYVFAYERKAHARAYEDDKLILGMTALIFQKPVTGEDLEGRAVIVGRASDTYDDGNLQQWIVRFPDNHIGYKRTINIELAELEFKYK